MTIEMAIAELQDFLGERLSRSAALREQHGHDEAHTTPAPPDAVAFALNTGEVARIMQICSTHDCPITPFGAGTSLEGQVIPTKGGISLDMGRMNAVLAVHPEDLDVVVQPGVTRRQLDAHLRDTGLFFPVDPGADASIGGMTATRASGSNAVRYGTMRENVLALEVVTAGGEIIRTGTRARKSSSGYDLTKLFVGSEGTLGIITEITLRLHGQPEAISSAVCAFNSIDNAVNTVILAIQSGLPMARIELLDDVQMQAVNAYSELSYVEKPTLFLEFHGTRASLGEQVERFGEIAAEFNTLGFEWANLPEERNKLWRARHDAYYAVRALRPGANGYVTDVCVPISRLADCIAQTRADLKNSPLQAPLVGHAGDGNFHLCMLIDPSSPAETAEAERIAHALAHRALEMDGTVTGEHGIGLGKKRYMAAEHGGGAALMAQIKRALDPRDLLNPGKIFDLN